MKNFKKDISSIIRKPRITEKGAVIAGTNNVYPFDVRPDATKKEIAAAIKAVYKVTPVKIATISVPAKSVRSRRTGKMGRQSGGKKAYVYLKKGDKIEFV